MKFYRETYEYVINMICDKMEKYFPNKFCANMLYDSRVESINTYLSEYCYYF